MIDPYRVLGLPMDASTEDVHAAYRRLARRYHPDRNSDPAAPARMVEVNEAYSWLRDGDRRRQYDRRFVVRESESFQRVVLDAALDMIRASGVALEEAESGVWILEPRTSRIGVVTVGVIGDFEFDQAVGRFSGWHRAGLGFAVVMGYRVVARPGFMTRWPDAVPPGGAIDLARSEWFGSGPAPYPEPLAPFVAS